MYLTSIVNGFLMEWATQRLMFSGIIMDYKVTRMRLSYTSPNPVKIIKENNFRIIQRLAKGRI